MGNYLIPFYAPTLSPRQLLLRRLDAGDGWILLRGWSQVAVAAVTALPLNSQAPEWLSPAE
jgi:hypothetical protein